MACNRLLYAVREYGPYVIDDARRNRDPNIPTLASRPPVISVSKEDRQEELDQQFNPAGIPIMPLRTRTDV
jgi:hypothetical protein